jgi:CheY-like chemotaxis protein
MTAATNPVTVESRRLLVVDDEPSILKLLKTLLTRAKYQVATCSGGDEAMRLLSQGQFDLLITDAIMPVMNGFDLVRAIRRNPSFQELPILMLTRKGERADVQKALEAGVTDYVLKPIDEHLLVDKVESSLQNRETGKRLREIAIHGAETRASASLDVRIISLRETGMVMRFPVPVSADSAIQLEIPLFKQIGIKLPILRLTSCLLKPAREAQSLVDFPYEAEFTFVGMTESDLKKIRTWLQKQEIQRKK